jgi:hypothetical protein
MQVGVHGVVVAFGGGNERASAGELCAQVREHVPGPGYDPQSELLRRLPLTPAPIRPDPR